MSLQPNNYQLILNALKDKIRQARFKAALAANAQLLAIYWEVGQTIIQQENEEGWGAKTVERLSVDLRAEFEDMKGLSARNLRYMREFAKSYPRFLILQQAAAKLKTEENNENTILQQLAAKLPWGHHQLILDKVKQEKEKYFYIQKCIENSWSRSILSLQIENDLYQKQGKSINNFQNTLPAIDSDLARETFKSSYIFDFLTLSEEAKEKDVERALIQHLKKFMLELGRGFAYVGNQKNINVDGDDFFLDLLFFN